MKAPTLSRIITIGDEAVVRTGDKLKGLAIYRTYTECTEDNQSGDTDRLNLYFVDEETDTVEYVIKLEADMTLGGRYKSPAYVYLENVIEFTQEGDDQSGN